MVLGAVTCCWVFLDDAIVGTQRHSTASNSQRLDDDGCRWMMSWVALDDDGRRWMMSWVALDDDGCCWMMSWVALDDDGCCWMLLDIVGC